MNFSLFENDGTLGALQGVTTLRGRIEAWFSMPVELQAWLEPRLRSNGISGSVSPSRSLIDVAVGQALRFSVDVSVNTPAGETREQTKNRLNAAMQIIAARYPSQIWNVGEFTIISRTEATNGNPDLVGNASVFTPTVRTPQTIKAGALATVNVPISFDDDPAVKGQENIGWLDTVKGLDTTTLVLLGVAAVLVLKRL